MIKSGESPLNTAMAELYAALQDNTVERKWKKKAVALMVEIYGLQNEMKNKTGVPEETVKKAIRQAEGLLNQLNRY